MLGELWRISKFKQVAFFGFRQNVVIFPTDTNRMEGCNIPEDSEGSLWPMLLSQISQDKSPLQLSPRILIVKT